MSEHMLWVEKYRPQTIEDCILNDGLKKTFQEFVNRKEIPNLLLCGTAGVGKTTVARALCNEIGCDYIIINGSDENGVDAVRTKIKNYASSMSLHGGRKVVILDEADYLTPNAQAILRAGIEEFAENCSFIFTCNFKNRIIEPLHSRCAVIEFKIDASDKQQIAAQFFKRASQILKEEQIEFDPKVVAELITKHFPDYRRILNELQRYSVSGKIDSGILVNMSEESFKSLIRLMKEKDFVEVRKWVAKQSDADTTTLFREFYNTATQYIEPNSIPSLVLLLADYQFKAAFVADHELNIMAALTEIMAQCKFK